MDCQSIQKLVDTLAVKDASATVKDEIQTHAQSCSKCAQLLHADQAVFDVVRSTFDKDQSESGDAQLAQAVFQEDASAGAAASGRGLSMFLSIAAVLILVMGAGYYASHYLSHENKAVDEVFASEEVYVFLRAKALEADNPAVMLQEYKEFTVQKLGVGDSILDHKITAIHEDGISYDGAQGRPVRVTRDSLQQAADEAVAKDVVAIHSQAMSRMLRGPALHRLESLSLLGYEDAMTALADLHDKNRIDSGSGPNDSGTAQRRRLEALAGQASNKHFSYRKQSMTALASVMDPMALQTLGKIARDQNESDTVRVLAVELCASRGDGFALKFILSFLQEPLPDKVRKAAQNCFDTLFSDLLAQDEGESN